MTTALATAVFTLIFLFAYKYLINPQIVYTPDVKNMSQCPDRWNYNQSSKLCEPGYDTSCLPFNPDSPTLNSLASRCNIARSCGTTWSEFCG